MKVTNVPRIARWMVLATALGALAPVTVTATPQLGPSGDEEVAEFIQMDFRADSRLTGASFRVTVASGIVTLTGTALSLEQAERAAARCLVTKGTRAVINQVRISDPVASDATLQTRIEERLKKSPAVDASRVKVRVEERRAILSGDVGTWDEQELARALAAGVIGIRDIDNRLGVSFETIRTDAAIQAQLVHQIAADPLCEGLTIQVKVKDGVATLSGDVGTSSERLRLIRASHVTGIIEVKAKNLLVDSDLAMEGMGDKVFTPDETLAALRDALAADSRVQGAEIQSGLMEGILTLTGTAPTSEARSAAESTARGLPGVLGVSNQLRVTGQTGDGATAANVTAALKSDPQLAALTLSADCRKGVCTIGGQAFSAEQKDHAARIAGKIAGVKTLRNEIAVEGPVAADTRLVGTDH